MMTKGQIQGNIVNYFRGMGCYAPTPLITPLEIEKIENEIVKVKLLISLENHRRTEIQGH